MKKINNKNITVYVNGKFLPQNNAKISIYDLGFTNGHMVYDTFRTFNKKPIHVNEHIDRLYKSARYLNIDTGINKKEIVKIINILLKKNIPLLIDTKAILWHRVSYSLGSQFSFKKILLKLSSLLKLYNKHVKWPIRYFSFCLLLLRMLISGIKRWSWKKWFFPDHGPVLDD